MRGFSGLFAGLFVVGCTISIEKENGNYNPSQEGEAESESESEIESGGETGTVDVVPGSLEPELKVCLSWVGQGDLDLRITQDGSCDWSGGLSYENPIPDWCTPRGDTRTSCQVESDCNRELGEDCLGNPGYCTDVNDDPRLMIDDTGEDSGFHEECAVIAAPCAGRYEIGAYYYSTDDGAVDAQVQVTFLGEEQPLVVHEISPREVWYVGALALTTSESSVPNVSFERASVGRGNPSTDFPCPSH